MSVTLRRARNALVGLAAAMALAWLGTAIPGLASTATLMGTQNADGVAILGGTIDGTVIGGTTPAAATFTTVTASTSQQAATLYGGGTTAANASFQAPTIASAVNQVVVSGAATGSVPTIVTGGSSSDTNRGIALSGKGTGTVLIGGLTTTLAGLQVGAVTAQVNDLIVSPTATGNTPGIEAGGAGADATVGVAFGTQGTGTIAFDTATTAQQFSISHTASAVNNVNVTGSIGTASPVISPIGTGATLGIQIAAKSTGATFIGGTTNTNASLQVATVASAVNQVVVTPGATGTAPTVTTGGASADANRNLNLAGNGTGLVILGQTICTSSGVTPQTCNGQRGIATTASMNTAASTSAAVYVINNSSVTTTSLVECSINAYSGTRITNGTPVIDSCVPGSGTITVGIANIHTANALSGTVGIGFTVLN